MDRWVTFAGFVLVFGVLYWAQPLLIPVALAALISFVLSPPVGYLQRRIGRAPAVLTVVAVVFTLLILAGWGVAAQASQLATDLPRYRANIRQKIADVRRASSGGTVETVQQTLDDIKQELERGESSPRGSIERPLVVQSEQVSSLWGMTGWLGPMVGPLSTAGLVVALVIFMLLEREELRGRLIGLIGHGQLAVTTKAFDEASRRVSRQLLMQTLVNAMYGGIVGVGLWVIGVPYPLTWAALGAVLRFIPYLGPLVAAGGPILVALAALPGWTQPLWTAGLFIAVELFTNMVLETVLYAGAAGVSQVALLVAVAGWTWLWGTMGLLLATPLTVCLVVLGKHVTGLEFLSMLMADSPALAADAAYYQRLLARDQSEAAEVIARQVASQPPETVYDALLLPALNYAERDRLEGRLTPDEEQVVLEATRELLQDADTLVRKAIDNSAEVVSHTETTGAPPAAAASTLTVLGLGVNRGGDNLALAMLAQLVAPDGIAIEQATAALTSADLIDRVRNHRDRVVCLADLPPSPSSKARYIVRKLRAALPEVTIVVGRWAPVGFADEDMSTLAEAGADRVASTLLETRDQLLQIRDTLRASVSPAA